MKKVIALLGTMGLPFIALAQTIQGVLSNISNILNLLTPILITVAVLYFFWGLIEYIRGGTEEKEKGRSTMVWGIIALFVMVSVFGLIQLVGNTLGIRQGGGVNIPQLPR